VLYVGLVITNAHLWSVREPLLCLISAYSDHQRQILAFCAVVGNLAIARRLTQEFYSAHK
jgi:hypothetical protein